MKRSINELLAYLFAVLFGGAACWALGTDRCVASVTAMVVTCACTVWFTCEAIRETVGQIRASKKVGRR